MLETWEAQRLERIIQSGRTRPLLVECSRSQTSITDEDNPASSELNENRLVVIKSFDLPEITNLGLFNEIFGNMLARELGLNTPAPCLVSLSTPFVDAANTILRKHELKLRPGIASGCEYFSGGYSNATAIFISASELEQAARIYGYDLLVQNPDRTVARPNCATRAGRFKVYDFETAFSFVLLIGSQNQPWEVSKHGLGPKHLFFSELLRKKHELDWQPFIRDVMRINGDGIDEMMKGLPPDWLQHAKEVRAHLLAVAKNANSFHLELRRSLL